MAALILPSRRVWQPQGPVGIDYGNPIAAECREALVTVGNHHRFVVSNIQSAFVGGLSSPVISGKYGFGAQNYASNSGNIALARPILASSNATVLTVGRVSSSAVQKTVTALAQNSSGGMLSVSVGDGTTPGVVSGYAYLGGAGQSLGGSFTLDAEADYVAAIRQINGVEQSLWVNGSKDPIVTNRTGNPVGYSFFGRSGASAAGIPLFFAAVWARALSDSEIEDISDNPWQLFRPLQRRIMVAVSSGGASHSLDAAAQAAAAATAALSVQASAQLAGSAQAQAAASATMLKGVTLAAASIAQAGASASLAHGVPLAASAAAVAASSGGLALGVTLAASAIATAAASAGLTVTQQNALSANASAQASGSAVLSLQVLLSAAAVAQAAAAATASVGKTLAANAVGQAGGSAALQVGAATDLGAAAQAQASAGAQLAVEIPLSAQALAQAIASGSLTVAVRLQANALATSSATATFSEEVRLSAGAKAMASAQAVLQIGPLFTRAPDGSGYRRPQPIGDRPPTGQSYRMRTTNTTRPGR